MKKSSISKKRPNPRAPDLSLSPAQTRSRTAKMAEKEEKFQLPPPLPPQQGDTRPKTKQPAKGDLSEETEETEENEFHDEQREYRAKYSIALSELARKEQEILALTRDLQEQRSKVIKSADLKPMKFNGSADLEDYLKQFSSIARFNGWNSQQKVAVLMSKLEGEALTAAAVLRDPSFDELVRQLREIFSVDKQELASLKLKTYRQQDESLECLSLEIQKLGLKAFPALDNAREQMTRDAFINAIADDAVRSKLRDRNLKTLKECLSEAKLLETNQKIERTWTKASSSVKTVTQEKDQRSCDVQSEVRKLRDEVSRLRKMTVKGGTHCKSRPPTTFARTVKQYRRDIECYKCTMRGHIAKSCPFPDETITRWVKEGLISLPFSRRKPQENGNGKSSNGRMTPR